jgi:hypothetical protein
VCPPFVVLSWSHSCSSGGSSNFRSCCCLLMYEPIFALEFATHAVTLAASVALASPAGSRLVLSFASSLASIGAGTRSTSLHVLSLLASRFLFCPPCSLCESLIAPACSALLSLRSLSPRPCPGFLNCNAWLDFLVVSLTRALTVVQGRIEWGQ